MQPVRADGRRGRAPPAPRASGPGSSRTRGAPPTTTATCSTELFDTVRDLGRGRPPQAPARDLPACRRAARGRAPRVRVRRRPARELRRRRGRRHDRRPPPDPAETIARLEELLGIAIARQRPPRRRRRSAPRRQRHHHAGRAGPGASRSPSTKRASSTVTAEYSEPATATSESRPWLVASAKSEFAWTSKKPIASRIGSSEASIRIEGRTDGRRDERASPRPPTRAATIVQAGWAPEAASSPKKKTPKPERRERRKADRGAPGRAPLGSGSRATRTTPTMPATAPTTWIGGGPIALHHARRHRTEHPQGADRRDDGHRAERHGAVEGGRARAPPPPRPRPRSPRRAGLSESPPNAERDRRAPGRARPAG